MRIRKHAKLASSAPFSVPVRLSTWEKKNTSSSSSSSSRREETGLRYSQSRRENEQGSFVFADKKQLGEESNPESVDLKGLSVDETTKEEERGNECKRAKSVEVEEDEENYEKQVIYCERRSIKGSKCKKEAKGRHSLSDHHEPRRKPDRTAGVIDPSFVLLPPSSDFYYYAGFAPLVRTRRRRRESAAAPTMPSPPSSSSSGEDAHPRAGDCDGDDREKKRGRKPTKSRSLKSLL